LRENPATWQSYEGALPPAVYDRGFTGHEHLYGFNLINMGGRVYDPIVSRFLSPDPALVPPFAGFRHPASRRALTGMRTYGIIR